VRQKEGGRERGEKERGEKRGRQRKGRKREREGGCGIRVDVSVTSSRKDLS